MNGMKFVEWNSEHSLNVPKLDAQHRDMMEVLNDAISHTGPAVDEKNFYRKKVGIAKKLMLLHFKTEERLLKKTHYPNLSDHKAQHKVLLEELLNINSKIENGKNELNLFNVIAHLKELFLKHIKSHDKIAQEYFEKGSKKLINLKP